jgi:WD40 repeat protein
VLLPVSKQFIVQSAWDSVGLYRLADLGLVRTFGVGASVNKFDVTQDEQTVLVGCDDGSLSAWDVATGAQRWGLSSWSSGQHYIQDVCFADDGRSVIICGMQDDAFILNVQTGRKIGSVRFPPGQTNTMSAALSPDGSTGVVLDLGERLYAFDVSKGQLRPTGVTGAWPVRYSRDGRYVALRSNNSGQSEQLRVVRADDTWAFRDLGEFNNIGHIKPIEGAGFLAAALVNQGEDCAGVLWRPETERLENLWQLAGQNRERTDFEPTAMVGVCTDHRLVTRVVDLRIGAALGTVDNSADYRPTVVTYTSRDIIPLMLGRLLHRSPIRLVGVAVGLGVLGGVVVLWRIRRRQAPGGKGR